MLIGLRCPAQSDCYFGSGISGFSTSAEETLACQYDGNPMSIGFKSTFLIDILNNIAADEVIIELADPSRAGVIIPVEQEENEELLMLLMPMMLND